MQTFQYIFLISTGRDVCAFNAVNYCYCYSLVDFLQLIFNFECIHFPSSGFSLVLKTAPEFLINHFSVLLYIRSTVGSLLMVLPTHCMGLADCFRWVSAVQMHNLQENKMSPCQERMPTCSSLSFAVNSYGASEASCNKLFYSVYNGAWNSLYTMPLGLQLG